MTETDHSDSHVSLMDQPLDVSGAITTLRLIGANQFDPVRFHYLEALDNRKDAQQGRVKRILEEKLVHALGVFGKRFERAQREARDAIDAIALQYPHVIVDLQRDVDTGDFRRVRQRIAALKIGSHQASLADLTRDMVQRSPEKVDGGFDGHVGSRSELNATQYFRNTWSKLSVEKRVTQALDQAPTNAGPINSHRLVLRSLALMRDISPDYLNRFTSYVDALLCLDQRDVKSKPAQKKSLTAKAPKK